ncbi:MAG: hypothetical protein V8T61_02450 [Alistipes inops]
MVRLRVGSSVPEGLQPSASALMLSIIERMAAASSSAESSVRTRSRSWGEVSRMLSCGMMPAETALSASK